ncbi:MAG: hypothetical protein F2916_05455 [Actinobacteria bacterium]|uniref:Unannotated protein n=1 Tax=freshwater metagenome TaxID=449393 RepID=A0A6J6AHV2_9ZZZZ|nr:hypothetical protein [Actinomycetota bacterium]
MTSPVVELIGVYDADSTLLGEISYWVGARFGITHCSLCELTHGLFTKKAEWKQCADSLAVPFRLFHRDDAPDDVLIALAGEFPAVLQRTTEGLKVILIKDELERFHGRTADFAEWITEHLSSS